MDDHRESKMDDHRESRMDDHREHGPHKTGELNPGARGNTDITKLED
jgi:hypothetical protein